MPVPFRSTDKKIYISHLKSYFNAPSNAKLQDEAALFKEGLTNNPNNLLRIHRWSESGETKSYHRAMDVLDKFISEKPSETSDLTSSTVLKRSNNIT